MRFAPSALLLSSAVFVLGGPARGGILTVDDSGGANFTSIAAAVAAAQDGDVLLVKAGTYPTFEIVDKSISVIADTGHEVFVIGSVRVTGLTAGKRVILDRLNANGGASMNTALGYGLYVRDCAGSVRVQGGSYHGEEGISDVGPGSSGIDHPAGWNGALIEDCADVSIALCELRGGHALNTNQDSCACTSGQSGGAGLRSIGSSVAVYDVLAFGGAGGDAWVVGGAGGHGVLLGSSTLVASNGHFTGAVGGDADEYLYQVFPGAGGNAIYVASDSSARVLGGSLAAGHSGTSLWQSPTLSTTKGGTGQLKQLTGSSKGFNMPKALREGTPSNFVFAAQAGDQAYLMISALHGAVPTPQFKGVLLLDPSTLIGPISIGPVMAGGTLVVPFNTPSLPVGIDAAGIHLQAIYAETGGAAVLGSPSHFTVISSLF